jgi:hypothetical protein
MPPDPDTGNPPPDLDATAREEIATFANQILYQCLREAGAEVVADSMKQNLAIEIVHTAKLAKK